MSKVTLDLDIKEAKDLIEQMTLEDKIKLIRELEKETWVKRINKILNNIDARRKKHKISFKEISQETKAVRKRLYAKRYH